MITSKKFCLTVICQMTYRGFYAINLDKLSVNEDKLNQIITCLKSTI